MRLSNDVGQGEFPEDLPTIHELVLEHLLSNVSEKVVEKLRTRGAAAVDFFAGTTGKADCRFVSAAVTVVVEDDEARLGVTGKEDTSDDISSTKTWHHRQPR